MSGQFELIRWLAPRGGEPTGGRSREALLEYQALLAMNPQDLAEAHYRLAKTYVALEDRAKGREHLLYALEIAPHYREAQQLLLEVVR